MSLVFKKKTKGFLKEIQRKLGLGTYRELARLLGVPFSTLEGWLYGDLTMLLKIFNKINGRLRVRQEAYVKEILKSHFWSFLEFCLEMVGFQKLLMEIELGGELG